MQREAKKQMQESGIGTKSQQALKLQQEQNKQERKVRSREKKEAEELRMFELKQQKKRERGCRISKFFLLGGSLVLCSNGIKNGCGFDAILYKRSSSLNIPFGMSYFKLFCFNHQNLCHL